MKGSDAYMKRIAIIEDGYVRDTQIYTANPDIIEKDPDWENHFIIENHTQGKVVIDMNFNN